MRALLFAVAACVASVPALANNRVELAFEADEQFQTERAAMQSVRAVIERQIEALRRDDANAAFAQMAPRLKEKFGDGDAYLRVIHAQFPAILNARIVSFGDLRETSFGTAQAVNLSSGSGEQWLAFFLMDRQDKPCPGEAATGAAAEPATLKGDGRVFSSGLTGKCAVTWSIANVVLVKVPSIGA